MPARPRKSDYLYTNFLPNFPPISIPFSKEKHPIWIKLGAFYNNLPKIHPIYVIWAPSSLMKTPRARSLYQISRKSAPKGRHIGLHVYHVNVRTPTARERAYTRTGQTVFTIFCFQKMFKIYKIGTTIFYVAHRTLGLLVMFCVLKFYFVDFYGMFTSSPTWRLKMHVQPLQSREKYYFSKQNITVLLMFYRYHFGTNFVILNIF